MFVVERKYSRSIYLRGISVFTPYGITVPLGNTNIAPPGNGP
jgi:hypothetical protein